MILVAGIPDERPVALVTEALDAIGANYRVFDQRRVAAAGLQLAIGDAQVGGSVGGTLTLEGETVSLSEVSGMYLRLMDDRALPGVAELPPDSPERTRCRRFHELLLRFADVAPGRVLNRPADTASNHSKPYQAQLIRESGFDIPETLITNDPDAARAFMERIWSSGGGVIYKSISGIRSIVRRVEQQDLARLDQIRWCPTQFQRHVAGTDIRVHVVGDTALVASISSDATDYRYAARETGVGPKIAACELEPRVELLASASPRSCGCRWPASTCGGRQKAATPASKSIRAPRSATTRSTRGFPLRTGLRAIWLAK